MHNKAPVRLVLVHGIGGPRDSDRERAKWLAALAEGCRTSGHSMSAKRLGEIDTRFVNYSDLFDKPDDRGDADTSDTGELVDGLVHELVKELSDEFSVTDDPQIVRILTNANTQLSRPQEQRQGSARILANVLTTVLQLPGLRRSAQWISGRQLLGVVSQLGRYLDRQSPDSTGRSLDVRCRDRLIEALPADGPVVVVAHSLGSVVAVEALNSYPGSVPLLVTLGSPIAMGALVWQRLLPQPPRTSDAVQRWLNFWDRDDVVVARALLEKRILPNATGVRPCSQRVDSDGWWVHDAEKYLRQAAVAGPVVEALQI